MPEPPKLTGMKKFPSVGGFFSYLKLIKVNLIKICINVCRNYFLCYIRLKFKIEMCSLAYELDIKYCSDAEPSCMSFSCLDYTFRF